MTREGQDSRNITTELYICYGQNQPRDQPNKKQSKSLDINSYGLYVKWLKSSITQVNMKKGLQ